MRTFVDHGLVRIGSLATRTVASRRALLAFGDHATQLIPSWNRDKKRKNTVAKDLSPFAMNIAQQKKKNLPSNELQTANPLEQGHGRQGQKEAAFARNV